MLKPAIPPGPNRSPHRRRRWSKPRDTFAGEATEGGEHRARNVVEVFCEAQCVLRGWWNIVGEETFEIPQSYRLLKYRSSILGYFCTSYHLQLFFQNVKG